MVLIIIVLFIALWGGWKFIKYQKNNKKVASFAYLLIFLGFIVILISMFYPGGFEGMAIAFFALIVGVIGMVWAFIYTVVTNIKKAHRR